MPISKCHACSGTGKFFRRSQCPDCKGLGSTKISLSTDQSGETCQTCQGTGKIESEEQCQRCGGNGEVWQCLLCGLQMSFPKDEYPQMEQRELCDRCKENPVVYRLIPPYDINLVRPGRRFIGKILSFKPIGAIIELAPNIEGFIRKETLTTHLNPGEILVVRTVRAENNNIELAHIPISDYRTQDLYGNWRFSKIQAIHQIPIGQLAYLRAEISGIKQTSGPTIFTFTDETGVIQGVNFDDGRRNASDFEIDMIVDVSGKRIVHRGTQQIEIATMQQTLENQAEEFRSRLQKRVEDKSQPDSSVSLQIDTPTFKKMEQAIVSAATRIRKAVLEGQKIVIRHHTDVDGFCGAIALEYAIHSMLEQEGVEEENYRRRVQRQVSRIPYYGAVDTIRDLNFAVEEADRFGGKIPLLILVDIGSTYESQLAYNICQVYSQDVIVIDHHTPSLEMQNLVNEIVNPYLVDGDYSLTSGMISVEVAHFINSKATGRINHLAAIAAVADHMEGAELAKIKQIVERKGYTSELIEQTVKALNYYLYLLKSGDGGVLIKDILGLSGERDRHRKLVELLSIEADKATLSALDIALPNIGKIDLENQIIFYMFDIELFGDRKDYPPAGKLTGALHDYLVNQNPQDRIVTLGYGSDFGILRSNRVKIDFPEIVKELQQENSTLGIRGGGHMIVGSINFIEGTRKEVLQKLVEKIESINTSNTSEMSS